NEFDPHDFMEALFSLLSRLSSTREIVSPQANSTHPPWAACSSVTVPRLAVIVQSSSHGGWCVLVGCVGGRQT
ncbi:MAG: hypothetical protein NTV80_00990, partial [Verrucomicrobia bacterium]|nr:hypothetical protein [Verrucomicrobiota bacterium]